MEFQQIAAPRGARPVFTRAVDTPAHPFPDRFTVMSVLRAAAPGLGLRAPVLATLDAMLSCLPPQRGHHIVFASNATLLARLGATCDRTLRRHVAALSDAGLLCRRDSANGKRFARRAAGQMAAFGLDLAPLFARITELATLAADLRAQADRVALLRTRLRAAVQDRLARDPADAMALAALPHLRRKLDEDTLIALCDSIVARPALPDADVAPQQLSASDGQNVRHHQKSETELIDNMGIEVSELISTCDVAAGFAIEPIRRAEQVVHHARTLAPMMGIPAGSYEQAERQIGQTGAALTIWLILQLGQRVQNMGAYFHAITQGRRQADFNPAAVIRRMAGRLSADNGGAVFA